MGAAVLCASFMSFGVKRRWFALGAALQLAISTYAAYVGGLRPRPRRELSLGRKKAPQRLCGRFSRISMKLPRIPLRRQKLPKVVGKDDRGTLPTQAAAGSGRDRVSIGMAGP